MRHPAAYYATYWSVKTTIGKGSGLYIVLYLAQFRSFSFFVLPQVSHMFRFWPRVFVRFVVHIGEKRVEYRDGGVVFHLWHFEGTRFFHDMQQLARAFGVP